MRFIGIFCLLGVASSRLRRSSQWQGEIFWRKSLTPLKIKKPQQGSLI